MQRERFRSISAVLIALVTILGASAACLSTVAASQAGDEDFFGMSAAINAQKAEIINRVNAFEHYRAFTSYKRYLELGSLLSDESVNYDSETAAKMRSQTQEYWGLAGEMSQTFFLPRYLNQDKSYDLQRELDEAWAEDSQSNDLEPTSHFDKSDSLRGKSSALAGNMIVFAFAFWFLTLAQVTDSRLKYLWITLGVLAGLGGIFGLIVAEVLL